MEDGFLPMPGPTRPSKPLVDERDLAILGGILRKLDERGVEMTGTMKFKGHHIPIAFDFTTGKNVIVL